MSTPSDAWFAARRSADPLFCVVGSPVAHSLSPRIHAAFGAQTGRALEYLRVEVRPGELAAALAAFRDAGGVGMNVTVPLKEEAWQLAAWRSERAATAGAANTLWLDGDRGLCGDNTDGAGLVTDLERNHGFPLAGRRVLLLGAGGAARGVVPALLAARPATLCVSNRTAARAQSIADACRELGPVELLGWGAPVSAPFDLVVNATSLSLEGLTPELDRAAFGADTFAYDMMYGPASGVFQAWAGASGACAVSDGLGMLVEQAAEAFLVWHGVRPATAPVIDALRREAAAAGD